MQLLRLQLSLRDGFALGAMGVLHGDFALLVMSVGYLSGSDASASKSLWQYLYHGVRNLNHEGRDLYAPGHGRLSSTSVD